MGSTDNSGQVDYKNQWGNMSFSQDLSGLFGNNATLNLGAGSSSANIVTASTDLSSMFRDESTNTTRNETTGGGFGLDVGASVGVGVGGTGSAGSVDKTTANSFSEVDNSSITANRGESSGGLGINKWVLIGGGGFLGVLALIFILKKRK